MGGLILLEEWMGVDLGGVCGEQEDVREGEQWLVCRMNKTFKITREKKKYRKKRDLLLSLKI